MAKVPVPTDMAPEDMLRPSESLSSTIKAVSRLEDVDREAEQTTKATSLQDGNERPSTEISSSNLGSAIGEVTFPNKNTSAMRRYLESGVDFTWPPDCGLTVGNHCNLQNKNYIPLQWMKRISDKKASVDIYRGLDHYSFRQPFVVKTIRDSSRIKSRSQACHEVNTMRDLRHPHVAALLGTFLFQQRLSILIFPAACCDLHEYMRLLSKELEQRRPVQGASLDDSSTASGMANGGAENLAMVKEVQHALHIDGFVSVVGPSPRIGERPQEEGVSSVYDDRWPMRLPWPKKIEKLRSYFVCLAQALDYIHSSDVRHKDLKPENILIDMSGSPIVTDFGISRSFPKKAPRKSTSSS